MAAPKYNPPTSMEELAALTTQNTQYEGFGADTAVVFPCTFCAAPGSMRAKVVETERAMQRGGACKACGRSWRAIFTLPGLGSKKFEIVQCGGDDPPDWFLPPMRRVDGALDLAVFVRPECSFAVCPTPKACHADNACAGPDPFRSGAKQ